MWSFILHVLGVEPRTPSTAYNFWSGFGSDITEFAIVGAIWHGINCHESGCWRPGHRVTVEENGTHVKRCKRHHVARHDAPVA
jgi:hypothetical protein